MSDQTLKLAQQLLPHLKLLEHLQDLKTLAALSPMLKPPARAALISRQEIILMGTELTPAPMSGAQVQTCFRLVAAFKQHDSAEYALTNNELRNALTSEHARLLGSEETAKLSVTLDLIGQTLIPKHQESEGRGEEQPSAQPELETSQPESPLTSEPLEQATSAESDHSGHHEAETEDQNSPLEVPGTPEPDPSLSRETEETESRPSAPRGRRR